MSGLTRYELYIKLANKEYMEKLKEECTSYQEMAEKIGCSKHTVEKWLRAHELTKPRAVVHNSQLADRLSKIK